MPATIVANVSSTVTWTDNSGNLVAPDTVTLQVQRSNTNNAAWTPVTAISNPSTGVYTATYGCPAYGDYIFEWYAIKTSNGLSRRERTQVTIK